jgi:hypothetical protein
MVRVQIDRRAFLGLMARGGPGVLSLAGFKFTRSISYASLLAQNAGIVAGQLPYPIIDTHAHLQARGPHHPEADYGGAVANAIEEMDRQGISRTILMPPPFGPDSPGAYDFEDFAGPMSQRPNQLSCLGGGGTLNPMFHEAVRAGTADSSVQRHFDARANAILAGGALGFGEMSLEHFSFNPRHPYTSAPPDHPLMLRLADIAAAHSVPIDVHMEAVLADMPTPSKFLELSPNNPPSLKANIDRFRTLLAHNRNASIVWAHVGWDNTGDRTVMLCHDLMSTNPNLFMSLKIDEQSLPITRPVNPEGIAKPGWLKFTVHFADRILVGSDNFYDAPGIELRDVPRVENVMNFVRQLPPDVARRIAYENPTRLYRLPQAVPATA